MDIYYSDIQIYRSVEVGRAFVLELQPLAGVDLKNGRDLSGCIDK